MHVENKISRDTVAIFRYVYSVVGPCADLEKF